MRTSSFDFTLNELNEIKNLVSSEMLRSSDALDRYSYFNNDCDSKLFDYWYDRYQILKRVYHKLFSTECEVLNEA